MFSLRSPKVTLPLPRPPFSKILDPPLLASVPNLPHLVIQRVQIRRQGVSLYAVLIRDTPTKDIIGFTQRPPAICNTFGGKKKNLEIV